MSQYMLLLYTTEEEELADRGAEMPMWLELNRSLEEAGLLVAAGRPFAITKEVLVGYYLIEAENLDQALNVAKRIPLIRYGRVEVRPVMDLSVE